MSTFDGLISEIEGISVDWFETEDLKSRGYFLSHCHSDHMVGIDSPPFLSHLKNNNYSIYTSEISLVILKSKYPNLKKHLKALNIEETHTILVPKSENCDEQFLSVTLIPAGHCPGSVMFLFKTVENVTILYTGDFRLYPKDLPKIKQLQDRDGAILCIDKMYFDSTFWNEAYPEFPSRKDSCDTICDIIREWIYTGPEYHVNLSVPAYYGSEFLYKDIFNRLKMPIHVHDNVYDSYRQIAEMDRVFTRISEETQIHSCTSIKGCVRQLMCRNTKNLAVRHIRPSALKWSMMKNDNIMPIFSEEDRGFFVCYSSHCSFNELKAFIDYLKPKSITPCVVPTRHTKCNSIETIREEFYESINSFCKAFLTVPCRMPDGELLDTREKMNDIKTPQCPDKFSCSKTKNSIKIVYPDSEEEEPPQKSSRLMTIYKSKMFAKTKESKSGNQFL